MQTIERVKSIEVVLSEDYYMYNMPGTVQKRPGSISLRLSKSSIQTDMKWKKYHSTSIEVKAHRLDLILKCI